MHLINGSWQEMLPANDRAVQFGDGCFTTARIQQGQIPLLAAHLVRLHDNCARLLIPFTQWGTLEQEMRQLAGQASNGVLKVIITRGSGGRGYSSVNCASPTRLLSVSDFPAHYAGWRDYGITLALSPVRLGRNPTLAGLKHLNRLEQVMIRTHLENSGADEALVLDSDGWVTECCAANLLWRQGKQVYTPRLDHAGVNGVMRQHIIAQLRQSPWCVTEVVAPLEALLAAEEVLICNALLPVVPVKKLGDTAWPARDLYAFLAPLCESCISL